MNTSARSKNKMDGTFADPRLLLLVLLLIGVFFCQTANGDVNDEDFRSSSATAFPAFSYLDHPIYSLLGEDPTRIEPVIMGKYFFKARQAGRTTSENGLFTPQQATYKFEGTEDYFCQYADIFVAPHIQQSSENDNDYCHIQLTRKATVWVLLALDNSWDYDAENPRRMEITCSAPGGLPSNWITNQDVIYPVQHDGPIDTTLVNKGRWSDVKDTNKPELWEHAIAVEAELDDDNKLVLPHHKSLYVNGRPVRRLMVVMAPPASTVPLMMGLTGRNPNVPKNFFSILATDVFVRPKKDPPIPNTSCPQWLHDLWVVQDTSGVYPDSYWRTWHPSIDPIYWCYYDHEHGGYPGHYRPKFHYTAFHTPDSSTTDGRQDESHEGFKVFPFVSDDDRAVVMVLHAHMSNGRRFHARHHTFIFTVFDIVRNQDDDNTVIGWDMEMELYRKADFGEFKAINTPDELQLPDQLAIRDTIWETTRQRAERDIYVFDLDKFPENDGYWVHGSDEDDGRVVPSLEDALHGRYEEWRCPLNCAVNPNRNHLSGLTFEFHEQQTGMKSLRGGTGKENLQRLSGGGMFRSVVFVADGPDGYTHDTVEFSAENCVFGGVQGAPSRDSDGVFYTDPYFTKVVDPNDNDLTLEALPQFIKDGFQKIVIGGHRAITNEDPNFGISSYDEHMHRRFNNMEMSVKVMKN